MDVTQVSAAGAVPQQPAAPAQTAVRQESKTPSQDIRTLEEMIREALEKADARRDQFQRAKPKQRYGDAPIEAYARLARARNQAGVSAAAGFARRKIIQLQSAKRTDSENAQQIQAAINQLRKAVSRAGKKKQDLAREQVSEKRRVKMEKEKRLREAKRLRRSSAGPRPCGRSGSPDTSGRRRWTAGCSPTSPRPRWSCGSRPRNCLPRFPLPWKPPRGSTPPPRLRGPRWRAPGEARRPKSASRRDGRKNDKNSRKILWHLLLTDPVRRCYNAKNR